VAKERDDTYQAAILKSTICCDAEFGTRRDQLRATEEELQIKSSALVEGDRQLAENQTELATVLRQLGERALVA
jgi:hypothetical protein